MHDANCAALVAVLFTTVHLIENLRLCSSAEAGIVLNLFLNFEKKEPRVLIKKYIRCRASDRDFVWG